MENLTTESSSNHQDLDKMSSLEILSGINKEDKIVPLAIEKSLPQIEKAVDVISQKINAGGRLFYIGAGTSGRLGVVDASECPPTFGVPHGVVIGIIAGGDTAIRKAVENAEDNELQAWFDLKEYDVSKNDVVLGIAASGTTPYVIHGLGKCQEENITTVCITNNEGAPITGVSDFPIEVVVGPEFLTGSTRMKAGTAQKLVLNMICQRKRDLGSGNRSGIHAKVVATSMPPPMPWAPRASTSCSMFCAQPHNMDAAVNSTMAARTNGLRPCSSPSLPKMGTVMMEVSR